MNLTTDNGTILDDALLGAPTINSYIRNKDVKDLRCFVATTPDEKQTYILFDLRDRQIIYASDSLEFVSARVDMIWAWDRILRD